MNRRMIVLAMTVAVATAVSVALGVVVQQAFTKTEIERIADAKRSAQSAVVVLQGKVYCFEPDRNTFILSDDSGSAELHTCPTWYKKIRLKEGMQATVTGHFVPQRPGAPKALYVLAVHTIEQPGGKQITLRTDAGRPPWASGFNIPGPR